MLGITGIVGMELFIAGLGIFTLAVFLTDLQLVDK
jgi:hypothetical protein